MARALQVYLPFRNKIQGILKLNSEDFADYFPPSKNGMTGPGVNHLSKKLVFFIKSPGY